MKHSKNSTEVSIGELLTPTLVGIETELWKWEAVMKIPPKYPMEAFRAICKLFMTAMLDKIWELQVEENMNQTDRENMSEEFGNRLKDLIKTFTNINTTELYENID